MAGATHAGALLILGCLAAGAQSLEPPAIAILQRRCVTCHDASAKTAGLDLTRRDSALRGGKTGPALTPGDAAASLLGKKIAAGQMPPGNPLAPEERDVILAWIRAGAPWTSPIETVRKRGGPDWWSLQPLRPFDASRTIDSFLDAALSKKNLRRSPAAERRTLIRRASYHLLGLPPAPEEVEAFVRDPDPDAYPKLVDRLLASPHYGERWGRHWLDVARFGESHGYEQNHLRDRAWPYRDYVIRSLNQDKPFNRMVLEQLAGDQIAPDDPDVRAATGFLVAGPHDTVKIQNVEGELQKRANDLDDMVAATGAAFLGLTVNCARCHDHKFDPILQADYYRLQSVFAGVEHAEGDLATAAERERRRTAAEPLERELKSVNERIKAMQKDSEPAVAAQRTEIGSRYRPAVDAKGTEERFPPVRVRLVRMTITSSYRGSPPALDEFEVWTAGAAPANLALASLGAKASARSTRSTGTAAQAYAADALIDGAYDRTWISGDGNKGEITIELPRAETIERIVWSRDRQGAFQGTFVSQVPTAYVILGSLDGREWQTLATSDRRLPFDEAERNEFFLLAVLPEGARAEWRSLKAGKADLEKQIAALPKLPPAYIGTFEQPKQPSHLLKRGDVLSPGEVIAPGSVSVLERMLPGFELDPAAPEGARRLALARWIVDDRNALTARVLANRVWQHTFGKGIVATPSDFGFNGEQPSHPELLDWLAHRLYQYGWRLKPLHRELMLSAAFQQSSSSQEAGLRADTDDRLLWRFPPRRLEAEEVRDSVLAVTGKLDLAMGGPGFRLYQYTVDNVATYLPAESFPASTWRRAVYQQAARSVKDDMLSIFDCPDSSLPEPKRPVTTTPLQALALLNSTFVLEQARHFAERLERDAGQDGAAQVERAFRLAFGRGAAPPEVAASQELVRQHGLLVFCRAILNANEFVYVL